METTGFMINNETRYVDVNSHDVETTFQVKHISPEPWSRAESSNKGRRL